MARTVIGTPLDFDGDYARTRDELERELEGLVADLAAYRTTKNGVGMVNYRHVDEMKNAAQQIRNARAYLARSQG